MTEENGLPSHSVCTRKSGFIPRWLAHWFSASIDKGRWRVFLRKQRQRRVCKQPKSDEDVGHSSWPQNSESTSGRIQSFVVFNSDSNGVLLSERNAIDKLCLISDSYLHIGLNLDTRRAVVFWPRSSSRRPGRVRFKWNSSQTIRKMRICWSRKES